MSVCMRAADAAVEMLHRIMSSERQWDAVVAAAMKTYVRSNGIQDRGYLGSNGTRKLRKKHGRNMGRKGK